MGKKLKAAILGFGGMGHVHAAAYIGQKDVELVACCDIDPAQFERKNVELNFGSSGNSDAKVLKKYLCYEDMVRAEAGNLDFVDIALPSDLHCEYAIRAMEDGFNVLCEKPMALTSRDAKKMIAASKRTGKLLMIAQCLRFNETFLAVKKVCDSGKYGKLLRLCAHRVSKQPGGWFRDVARSGGALMDLHLHDIDFIQFMLGVPDELVCFGVPVSSGGIDDSVTTYIYRNGPVVTAEGSWARCGWSCGMTVIFEKATLEMKGDDLFLYDHKTGKTGPLKYRKPKHNHYFNEIAAFAAGVKKGVTPSSATPESTCESIRIIETELKSALAGGKRVKL